MKNLIISNYDESQEFDINHILTYCGYSTEINFLQINAKPCNVLKSHKQDVLPELFYKYGINAEITFLTTL